MLRQFCDECDSPIASDQNHIEIQQMVIIDMGKALQFRPTAFCCKGCLNKFLDKAGKAPIVVSPHQPN